MRAEYSDTYTALYRQSSRIQIATLQIAGNVCVCVCVPM